MTIDLILKDGKVYTQNGFQKFNITIDKGKIISITKKSSLPNADQVINLNGKYVIPGLIDTHAHFRDPGFIHKEDFESGTKAAAAGGVTFALDMPNVNPVTNTKLNLENKIKIAEKKSIIDFNFAVAATIPKEIPDMVKMGALAIKIYMVKGEKNSYPYIPGVDVGNLGSLLSVFKIISKLPVPCMVHVHNDDIINTKKNKLIKEKKLDPLSYASMWLEDDAIGFKIGLTNALILAETTNLKIHFCHCNHKGMLDIIRNAKTTNNKITAEANPLSLFLKKTDIKKLGPYALTGTLTNKFDKESLWKSLTNGTIDVLGSDHAPHTKQEKEIGWKNAFKMPSGTPLIQDYLPLLLTEVNNNKLNLERLVYLTSEKPAKIFGLYPLKGALIAGSDADITIIDLNKEYKLKNENMYSKCKWTPFNGKTVKGMPIYTILRGKIIMENGVVNGVKGGGKLIKPLHKYK